MRLVVMIPAYNEEETIASVIKEIPRKIQRIDSVEVLVINDGSTDRTVEVAREAGADKILSHKANLGLGVTFRDGIEYALNMGADIIVNIDADEQYNAKEIPKLIIPIVENKADIVLGWRDTSNLEFVPFSKKMGNKVATWVTRRISGLSIRDSQTGFRAFSQEASLRMNLSGRYTYVQETLICAKNKDLRIEEVPVEFKERKGNSRLIYSLSSYAKEAGGIIIKSYRDYAPLKVFSYIGTVFIIVGIIFALRVLIHFLKTGMVSGRIPSAVLASMLIILGFLIFVLGLLADMLKTHRELQEEILYNLKKLKIEKKKR
ncbi:MAG: glycosyltransferase family 2 protein [Candidatus Aminicenantes bacterium]|nr:MAG: glycosyltransferase family 2 protein [Candidatus Aminicenantes bacterium]